MSGFAILVMSLLAAEPASPALPLVGEPAAALQAAAWPRCGRGAGRAGPPCRRAPASPSCDPWDRPPRCGLKPARVSDTKQRPGGSASFAGVRPASWPLTSISAPAGSLRELDGPARPGADGGARRLVRLADGGRIVRLVQLDVDGGLGGARERVRGARVAARLRDAALRQLHAHVRRLVPHRRRQAVDDRRSFVRGARRVGELSASEKKSASAARTGISRGGRSSAALVPARGPTAAGTWRATVIGADRRRRYAHAKRARPAAPAPRWAARSAPRAHRGQSRLQRRGRLSHERQGRARGLRRQQTHYQDRKAAHRRFGRLRRPRSGKYWTNQRSRPALRLGDDVERLVDGAVRDGGRRTRARAARTPRRS